MSNIIEELKNLENRIALREKKINNKKFIDILKKSGWEEVKFTESCNCSHWELCSDNNLAWLLPPHLSTKLKDKLIEGCFSHNSRGSDPELKEIIKKYGKEIINIDFDGEEYFGEDIFDISFVDDDG